MYNIYLMMKAASGIPTKMFDSAVAKVLKSDSNAGARSIRDDGERRVQRSFVMSNQDSYALSFLDIFFQGIMLCVVMTFYSHDDYLITDKGKRKMVDVAPNSTGRLAEARTIRMKWSRLHEGYYVPHIKKLNMEPLDYHRFCALRRAHRPLYIRHRKVG